MSSTGLNTRVTLWSTIRENQVTHLCGLSKNVCKGEWYISIAKGEWYISIANNTLLVYSNQITEAPNTSQNSCTGMAFLIHFPTTYDNIICMVNCITIIY